MEFFNFDATNLVSRYFSLFLFLNFVLFHYRQQFIAEPNNYLSIYNKHLNKTIQPPTQPIQYLQQVHQQQQQQHQQQYQQQQQQKKEEQVIRNSNANSNISNINGKKNADVNDISNVMKTSEQPICSSSNSSTLLSDISNVSDVVVAKEQVPTTNTVVDVTTKSLNTVVENHDSTTITTSVVEDDLDFDDMFITNRVSSKHFYFFLSFFYNIFCF